LLRTRHGASALEINFRFRRIRRRRFKSDFSGNAIDLSLEPGGLRAGAQSRRAIALQPVRADPPVVSALDPPMPASVPPPASAEDAKSSGPYWTSLRSHPIAGSPV
jgi:hypothetical protein